MISVALTAVATSSSLAGVTEREKVGGLKLFQRLVASSKAVVFGRVIVVFSFQLILEFVNIENKSSAMAE